MRTLGGYVIKGDDMSNGMTIDKLYEAFMDIDEFGDPTDPTPFAEDVFSFFGKDKLGGLDKEAWASKYGMYLPVWDPTQVHLAERERDLDYRSAMDTLKTTQAATERVYATEMDTLSTSLGKELSKGREIAGGIGLRSGGLESAIQDTIATTGSKAKDFGDRIKISKQEIDDKYNVAMVDGALDFDKTERQEKEEFYDRTMAMIMRLMDTGAFDEPEDPEACTEEQMSIIEGGGSITTSCVLNGEVIAAGWYDESGTEECRRITDITGASTCDPPGCDCMTDETYCDPQIDDPNHPMYCESLLDDCDLNPALPGCGGFSLGDEIYPCDRHTCPNGWCVDSPADCPEPCPGGCDNYDCPEGQSAGCSDYGCICFPNPFN